MPATEQGVSSSSPAPAFEPTNSIDLVSVEDSKISTVSLYTGRAEVTRVFSFRVNTGHNEVKIKGLPRVVDKDSVKVEGHGSTTIHGVTVLESPAIVIIKESPVIKSLLRKKEEAMSAINRYTKSLAFLDKYLESLTLQDTPSSQIGGILDIYRNESERLDSRILELNQELNKTETAIRDETIQNTPHQNPRLGTQVNIDLFAKSAGEVELLLTYAVSSADWDASYDLRIDTNVTEKQVSIVYKATIIQDTGEDWDNVSLILETSRPTFGVGVPNLAPWHLSIYRPPIFAFVPAPAGIPRSRSPSLYYRRRRHSSPRRSRERSRSSHRSRSPPLPQPVIAPAYSLASSQSTPTLPQPLVIVHQEAGISSKGSVIATFSVPGVISVASDNKAHSITIVQLKLDATLSWIAVPKKATLAHLNASINNASEYSLLRGDANVYVDGSFISRSIVPLVSPGEHFNCPLGVDPSIRITYHPLSKMMSKSGFLPKSRTANQVFSQRITIFNSRRSPIQQLSVLDQVPVSEDSRVKVKVTSPPLPVPKEGSTPVSSETVIVGEGVRAQWLIEDGSGNGSETSGRLSWICAIPAQGQVNLLLQWEVSSLANLTVLGL